MERISVVVPLYNEKDSLAELYSELVIEFERLQAPCELILVDDGSIDGSFSVLKDLQLQDNRLRIIRLRRNFGKSAALAAGFKASTGDVIVTLDADLQDRPHEMHKLLARLEEGCDLVCGWKQVRKDPISKRLASRLFNWMTAWMTGVHLHDINCGFKAYRRSVIEEIKVYGEMHRFIPVLASYKGFVVSEVKVAHQPRKHGSSKYGLGRLLGGFFDLITVIMLTRYSSKPLHVFGILGLISCLVGLAIEIYLTVGWFLERWIEDRPLFMLGIVLFLLGIQFIFFGLLAEMIAYSARREEDYAVSQVLEPKARGLRAGREVGVGQ